MFDARSAGAVPYTELVIERGPVQFVEDGSVPPDAKIVDHTWQYENKRGGPDRRFKDNRKLPIALYEDIRLKSSPGLNELIQISKADAGRFDGALARMQSKPT